MQRHYAVAIAITMMTMHMAAAIWHYASLYIAHLRSKQVPHCKYNFSHDIINTLNIDDHTLDTQNSMKPLFGHPVSKYRLRPCIDRYVIYVCQAPSQVPALVVLFCKIPISIPLKYETGIHRYFAKRYSVRCWYRVPVYSPN